MKRPSFQFYPADWLGNSNLRRCSHAEKGVWIDVMCLMHDSEEYGVLRWSLKEIAQAIGCKLSELKSLINKGVLKGADAGANVPPLAFTPMSGRKAGPTVVLIDGTEGPLWYSSRMVIDEHKRNARGGKDDALNHSPNDSPKGGFGEDIDDAPNRSPSRAGARPRGRPSTSTSSTQEPNGSFVSERREHSSSRPAASHLDGPPSPCPSLIPPDFTPDAAGLRLAAQHQLDAELEREKFVAHYTAKAERRENWQAAFRKWLLDAMQFRADRATRPTSARPTLSEQNAEAAARAKALIFGQTTPEDAL